MGCHLWCFRHATSAVEPLWRHGFASPPVGIHAKNVYVHTPNESLSLYDSLYDIKPKLVIREIPHGAWPEQPCPDDSHGRISLSSNLSATRLLIKSLICQLRNGIDVPSERFSGDFERSIEHLHIVTYIFI